MPSNSLSSQTSSLSSAASALDRSGSLDAATPRPLDSSNAGQTSQDYFNVPASSKANASTQKQQQQRHQEQHYASDVDQPKSPVAPSTVTKPPVLPALKPLSLALHKASNLPHLPSRSQSSQALSGVVKQALHPHQHHQQQQQQQQQQAQTQTQRSNHHQSPLLARRQASQPSLHTSQHGSQHPPPLPQANDKYSSTKMFLAMDKMEGKSHSYLSDPRSATSPDTVSSGSAPIGPGAFGLSNAGDEWQIICIRVLPLFNGESARGYVEEVNELVNHHVRSMVDRWKGRSISYLTQQFIELADMGMLTLLDKLEHAAGSDLLARLNETWTLFWRTIRPYMLALFLPYSTDPANMGTAVNSSLEPGPPAIDVHRLMCLSFRDQIILPLSQRLMPMCAREVLETGTASHRSSGIFQQTSRSSSSHSLYRSSKARPPSGSGFTASKGSTARAVSDPTSGRMLRIQMVSVLAMLTTGDAQQARLDRLAIAIRGFCDAELSEWDEAHWRADGTDASAWSDIKQHPHRHSRPVPTSTHTKQRRPHWSWAEAPQSDGDDEAEEEEPQAYQRKMASRQGSFTTWNSRDTGGASSYSSSFGGGGEL